MLLDVSARGNFDNDACVDRNYSSVYFCNFLPRFLPELACQRVDLLLLYSGRIPMSVALLRIDPDCLNRRTDCEAVSCQSVA